MSFAQIVAEKLTHHRKSLCGGNDLNLGISADEAHYVCRMIRLHVLNDKIIGLSAVKRIGKIIKPFVTEPCVNRIHDSDFLINYNIRIICHSVFNNVLTLKKVDIMVINTNVFNVLCNIHS